MDIESIMNVFGVTAGAAVLIPIIVIVIKVIYWMSLFARLGDIRDNQHDVKNLIIEQKKTNELLEKLLEQKTGER